ncbi:MAG TPA: YggT family protein [Rhizomicrobium sp.]|jgi:YggT family protein|nr:YggT family protein [Rhizomicrobium sp.]
MMNPIAWLLLSLVNLYWVIVVAAVILSWLIAFRVINVSHPFVRSVVSFLMAITEPVFRQVRKVVPSFGGIDISPVIVLIALSFVAYVIQYSRYSYI